MLASESEVPDEMIVNIQMTIVNIQMTIVNIQMTILASSFEQKTTAQHICSAAVLCLKVELTWGVFWVAYGIAPLC
jgi:hypothetical protein